MNGLAWAHSKDLNLGSGFTGPLFHRAVLSSLGLPPPGHPTRCGEVQHLQKQ